MEALKALVRRAGRQNSSATELVGNKDSSATELVGNERCETNDDFSTDGEANHAYCDMHRLVVPQDGDAPHSKSLFGAAEGFGWEQPCRRLFFPLLWKVLDE